MDQSCTLNTDEYRWVKEPYVFVILVQQESMPLQGSDPTVTRILQPVKALRKASLPASNLRWGQLPQGMAGDLKTKVPFTGRCQMRLLR